MSWGVESFSRKTHDKFVYDLPPNDIQQSSYHKIFYFTLVSFLIKFEPVNFLKIVLVECTYHVLYH